MKKLNEVFEILQEVIPNELSDHFEIEGDTDEQQQNIVEFIADIIQDIKDNIS